jgi:hypothetical protein
MSYLLLSAGQACGEACEMYRHLVFRADPDQPDRQVLIVLDEIRNEVPEKAVVYWHSQGQIAYEDQTRIGLILGRQAELHFSLASSHPAQTSVRTQPRARGEDRFICSVADNVQEGFFAAAFTRGSLSRPIDLQQDDDGAVELTLGQLTCRFTPGPRHLKFTGLA